MPFSINNIAVYLPDGIVTNEELALKFEGLKPEDVFKRTGVKSRRRTTEDFIMSDMVFEAAEMLFNENPEARQKIDTIILVGHGYDYKAPITAAILQHRLQISKNALTIDLPHGCTGYINGLAVSKGLIDGGMSQQILLLTGDTPSFVIDKNNSELQSIFSDSGTASYLSKNEVSDYEKFIFGTDGSGAESLMVRRSSSRRTNSQTSAPPCRQHWRAALRVSSGQHRRGWARRMLQPPSHRDECRRRDRRRCA